MDSDSLQQKALDVPEIDDSFDPNFEPQDGEEYLMKVVYERRKCPAIVVKPLKNDSQSNKAACHSMNEFNDFSPEHLKPNKIWKQMQLETFNDARAKVSELRERISKFHTNNFSEFPLIDECESWKIFCQENEPLTHIILNISQRDLEKLLEYQSNWLNAEDESVELFEGGKCWWLGKWIYSILVCLKLPLEPDVHNILRNIVKFCVCLRNKLDYDSVDAASPYNLIIYLIAQFYGQLDLLQYV